MSAFFESLAKRLADTWRMPAERPAAGRRYRCQCGRPVFFRNSQCLGCQSPLGFVPERNTICALTEVPFDRQFVVANDESNPRKRFRRCANLNTPAACNWLVPVEDSFPLCPACRLNRTIPDLSVPENAILWGRIEVAKRRLVAQLLELGLPVRSRVDDDTAAGLMFDFLRATPG
ncbi:MAG TPA: putative zinc-binding metallopeptidase, partial [Verrucomicrobiota bacterium]|nr:putative zinc-binding metallopeptidase [Verrucomicrobiota bacterium]